MQQGIVDIDPLPYQVGFAFDETAFPGEVAQELDRKVRELHRKIKTDNCRYFLTDSASNFRVDIANIQRYKGNRNSIKPFYFDYARDYLQEKWGAEMVFGHEADDEVSDIHRSLGEESILVSIDKDLWTVPGYHYKPQWGMTKEVKTHWVTEEEALLFHYTQIMTGDTTDNIMGAFKVGKVKAEKALAGCTTEKEMRAAAEGVYKSVYGEDPIKFQDWRGRWIKMDYLQIMAENEQLIHMGMDNRPEFDYEANYELL